MPMFEVTWVDANGVTQIDRFMTRAIATRAVNDLRYYRIKAWISAAPDRS